MKFSEFRRIREAQDGTDSQSPTKQSVSTKITLGDGNAFQPFIVSDVGSSEHAGKNANLSPIIRAFKDGGIWGWTKDKTSSDQKPVKVGSKKLFLAGGAVRDILKGKTPTSMELVTDATPSEIRKILKQNGFEEGGATSKNSKTFKVREKNAKGESFLFDITVNGEKFELSPFRKNQTGDHEHGSHVEDSKRRDLTINSLYLVLSNDNGPNKEIVDFHGGIHDLNNGKMKFLGDTKNKLKESPIRVIRAARFANRYGAGRSAISPEDMDVIRSSVTDLLKGLSHEEMHAEFNKGLQTEDIDTREFLRTCDELGVLNCLFPNTPLNKDFPKAIVDLHDSAMSLAWLLKDSDPEVRKNLKEAKKLEFLVDMLNVEPNWIDADGLEGMMRKFLQSGLTNKDVIKFATKLGGKKPYMVEALIKHLNGPRVRVFKVDENGAETVEDAFADLISPFTGKPTKDTLPEINERKKHMELNNFLAALRERTPRNQ